MGYTHQNIPKQWSTIGSCIMGRAKKGHELTRILQDKSRFHGTLSGATISIPTMSHQTLLFVDQISMVYQFSLILPPFFPHMSEIESTKTWLWIVIDRNIFTFCPIPMAFSWFRPHSPWLPIPSGSRRRFGLGGVPDPKDLQRPIILVRWRWNVGGSPHQNVRGNTCVGW